MLTEFCKGGTLIDFIRVNELNNEQVLQAFYQVSKAVQYLHSQNPPIIHRDIKVKKNKLLIFQSSINILVYRLKIF